MGDGRGDRRQLAVGLLVQPGVGADDEVWLQGRDAFEVEAVLVEQHRRLGVAELVLGPRPRRERLLAVPLGDADRRDAERHHEVLLGDAHGHDPLRLASTTVVPRACSTVAGNSRSARSSPPRRLVGRGRRRATSSSSPHAAPAIAARRGGREHQALRSACCKPCLTDGVGCNSIVGYCGAWPRSPSTRRSPTPSTPSASYASSIGRRRSWWPRRSSITWRRGPGR